MSGEPSCAPLGKQGSSTRLPCSFRTASSSRLSSLGWCCRPGETRKVKEKAAGTDVRGEWHMRLL